MVSLFVIRIKKMIIQQAVAYLNSVIHYYHVA